MGQQETDLKQQIRQMEEKVKSTTPEPGRLKQLQQAVSQHDKGADDSSPPSHTQPLPPELN